MAADILAALESTEVRYAAAAVLWVVGVIAIVLRKLTA
jgi:hypothetical protein